MEALHQGWKSAILATQRFSSCIRCYVYMIEVLIVLVILQSSLLHSRPKSTVGTPAYIAPEVLSRREYDGKVKYFDFRIFWFCLDFILTSLIEQHEKVESSKHTSFAFMSLIIWKTIDENLCNNCWWFTSFLFFQKLQVYFKFHVFFGGRILLCGFRRRTSGLVEWHSTWCWWEHTLLKTKKIPRILGRQSRLVALFSIS